MNGHKAFRGSGKIPFPLLQENKKIKAPKKIPNAKINLFFFIKKGSIRSIFLSIYFYVVSKGWVKRKYFLRLAVEQQLALRTLMKEKIRVPR